MKLNIALVGCDTSHSVYFSRLLNDGTDPQHVAGARVIAAVIDGNGAIAGSREKALANAAEIEAKYGAKLYEEIGDLPRDCDAIFIESTDGGRHLAQVCKAVEFQVPLFIDKPLTLGTKEAEDIFRLGHERGVPIMSCSSLRYDPSFRKALRGCAGGAVTGADIFGYMEFVKDCSGYFWYGIHSAEMLFAAMGTGLEQVYVVKQDDYDLLTGVWRDGRIGTIRGTRKPHFAFGGTLHTASRPLAFDVPEVDMPPSYAPMLRQVVEFVRSGISPIAQQETLEIIRFLESANKGIVVCEPRR